jgi:hypothetical protein
VQVGADVSEHRLLAGATSSTVTQKRPGGATRETVRARTAGQLEACQRALADGPDVNVVAGGTDLLPQMNQRGLVV